MKCKHLILCSGGLKIYSFLGVCKNLDLSELETISGCSAGAILGVLLCLWKDIDIDKVIEVASCDDNIFIKNEDINIRCLLTQFGINDGSRIISITENVCEEYTGKKRITFRELYEISGKVLYIYATNLSKKKMVVFSHTDTPDMEVATALRMSISVPLYFTPVLYEGDYFVDGAFFQPEPSHAVFKNHEPKKEDTVMIRTDERSNNQIKTIVDFITSIFDLMISIIVGDSGEKNKKMTCVGVDTSDIPFISHDFNKEKIEQCISKGENVYVGLN